MNIRDIDEVGILKGCVVVNDMVIIVLSYWLAYGLTHSWAVACMFPFSLKIELVIAALMIFPCHYWSPPLFFKRMARGNDILSRTVCTVFIQAGLMLVVSGFTIQARIGGWDVLWGSLIFFVLLYGQRFSAHLYLRRQRSKGHNQKHVLLVGHPMELLDVYHTFTDKSLGYKVVGIFTRKAVPEEMKIPCLGDRRMVMDYLKAHEEISDLYLVPDTDYVEETEEIYRYCENHLIRFYALPVFLDFLTRSMKLTHMGSTMVLSVREEPLQSLANRMIKRTFDIVVSGLVLLTIFPVLYVIAAIIIKIQSPGPVFFRQRRNGIDGREFSCIKFRSMHVNTQADTVQATKDDPRKFKFGNFMRSTNIDEFPQFINVFFGSMSLVGPRPHMLLHTEEYSKIINRYMVRHYVKPGITGWAQINGFRGETKTDEDMENRVKADIWYVENWSFLLDVSIMWHTVTHMLKHDEKMAY